MPDPRKLSSFRVGKLGMPKILGYLKQRGGPGASMGQPNPQPQAENYWPEQTGMKANIEEMERKAQEGKAQTLSNPAMPQEPPVGMPREVPMPLEMMRQRYANLMRPGGRGQ